MQKEIRDMSGYSKSNYVCWHCAENQGEIQCENQRLVSDTNKMKTSAQNHLENHPRKPPLTSPNVLIFHLSGFWIKNSNSQACLDLG